MATESRPRVSAYGVVALSCVAGSGGLLLFGLFLALGPPGLVDLGLGTAPALAVDALLSALFFAQHSGMVRRGWQRRLSALVPPAYLPAMYGAASGIVLLAVVGLWQEVGQPVVAVPAWGRWAIRLLWLGGAGIMLWSWRALGELDALGLQLIHGWPGERRATAAAFRVTGPYRWVRHPMYMATLLFLWGYPNPTPDRLLLNALWSLWVIAATRLEERDLAADLGDQYRIYQRRVPMLIPHRRPVTDGELPGGGGPGPRTGQPQGTTWKP